MAKVSRSLLKGIVKECLVEILAEGLGTDSELNENVVSKKRSKKKVPRNSHRRPADTISFDNTVDNAVKNITDDPVMAQILADTAKTTLQEQYAAGEPGGAANLGDPGVDLDALGGDLFSGAGRNWAYLAFDDKKS